MAAQQTKRHKIGKQGERIASKLVNGKKTNHTAPFDIVDFTNKTAYEVKTMLSTTKDLKIHISHSSWERKLDFALQYNITNMVLIAVVIYSKDKVEVYSSELTQHIRVNQMTLISE